MAYLDRQNKALIAGTGTAANMIAATTYPLNVGELAYSSDTYLLYVGKDPATAGSFKMVVGYIPTVTKTDNYTLTDNDYLVLVNGTYTMTLPTAVGINGRCYHIKNIGSGIVTVDANGTQTIDGELTQLIVTKYDSLMIVSDNSNWHIV